MKRSTAKEIALEIIHSQSVIQELHRHFLLSDIRLAQRIGVVYEYICKSNAKAIDFLLPQMVENLNSEFSDAIKRNILRTFQFSNLPENILGSLFETCNRLALDPDYPIAFKAFGITVQWRVCEIYEDLIPEFKLTLEQLLLHNTRPAIAFRTKKIFKEIEQREINTP